MKAEPSSPAIREAKVELLQNAHCAGQFPIVKRVVPFSFEILVGHTLEASTLHQKKFNQERRCLVVFTGRGPGLMAAGQPFQESPHFVIC